MPQKKKQHFVPKTYLKAFIDPIRPHEIPEHIPFEGYVWVIEKLMSSEAKRKAPENILWKSYFYNLEKDENISPIIEEFLSKIEEKYTKVLKKICAKELLNEEDIIYIAFFIDTLFRRTPKILEHQQSQIYNIIELLLQVDQNYNHNLEISDKAWKASHEMAKKQIVNSAGILSHLILKAGLVFVINLSKIPFISSDNPVTYHLRHIDDLYKVGIPKTWTYSNIGTNKKEFFCYCPLTPMIALISSPFIELPNESAYACRELNDPNFPFTMNIITHNNANSVLISNQPNPYGIHKNFVIRFLQKELPKGIQFCIYTSNARHYLNVDKYKYINTHPLKPEVHFWTKDFKTLCIIAQDTVIKVIEYYENGVNTGYTDNLSLYSVSLHPEEPSIIKANWL